MEDLHLQIDDIAKAKTAVRGRAHRAGLGAAEELNHDRSGCHRIQVLSCQGFLQDRAPHPHPLLCFPPLRAVLRGGRVGRRGNQLGCTSPCLTTCLWELGRRPWNHK